MFCLFFKVVLAPMKRTINFLENQSIKQKLSNLNQIILRDGLFERRHENASLVFALLLQRYHVLRFSHLQLFDVRGCQTRFDLAVVDDVVFALECGFGHERAGESDEPECARFSRFFVAQNLKSGKKETRLVMTRDNFLYNFGLENALMGNKNTLWVTKINKKGN